MVRQVGFVAPMAVGLYMLFVAAPSSLAAQPPEGSIRGEAAGRWVTIAEEGWWPVEDDRQLDLSAGWRVLQEVETEQTRIVPRAYGTAGWTIESFPFAAFVPSIDTLQWGLDGTTGYGWRSGGGGHFSAPLRVPSGLRVREIELEACDSSPSGEVFATLLGCQVGQTQLCLLGLDYTVSTGVSFDDGCGLFSVFPDPGVTIDNLDTTYWVVANTTGTSNTTRFRNVRVFLQRQVSPPPATATFGDVPTNHLFFRHIEALAASGVTAGCGDGANFCPGDPLTRGQMAVFLANALGLHWPDN